MALAVIPARFESTRFPGKVLVPIHGRPMIQHVWERARQADSFHRVIIATDSDEIFLRCREFGADVVLSANHHDSGTSRVAEVARDAGEEIIVNVQADEPLIDPDLLDLLIRHLHSSAWADVTTPVVPVTSGDRLMNPNVVKAVLNRNHEILYFSRAAIPGGFEPGPVPGQSWEHQGVYAFRRDALITWSMTEPSPLERAEDLEQLRFYDLGMKIRGVPSEEMSPGVNTPEDLAHVESVMKEKES